MELLLNTLKVSLIVGCAVLILILLKPLLRRRYHAKWKYYVWLVLSLAMLLPLAPRSQTWFSAVGEAAPIQIQVPAVVRMERPSPAGPDATPVEAPESGTAVRTDPAPAQETETPQQDSQAAETASVETLLIWIWGLGAVLFALYHLVGTAVFCHRSLRWSRPPERAFVREVMDETLRKLGIRRKVELWVSSAIDTPMMVGLIRPRLLLPTEHYSEQELRFILKHELTHYKRHDLWYKLALLSANAVHWFNPLAYLLVREANVDMELTCDDAVVAGADLETRRAYSETLLASIHKQKGFQAAALSTHFYGGAETMKARFRNILGTGKRKRGVVALCTVLALTITAGCVVGFTSQRTVELDAGELADWQEKLNGNEWNGFVTHMYGSLDTLSLFELFYDGAGISHEMTDADLAAYVAYTGYSPNLDMEAITTADLEAYLESHTGRTLADFTAGMGDWIYLEETDTYYRQHGDTNHTQVEVVSGTKTGDTVQLEVRPSEQMGTAAAWYYNGTGTLTITDGKVVSFTNDLYTPVEAMALVGLRDLVDSYQEDMPTSRSWMENLHVYRTYEGEDGAYYEWRVYYHMVPESTEGLTQGITDWLDSQGQMNYTAAYLVRKGAEDVVTQLQSEMGVLVDITQYDYLDFSFDEYCRYHYDYELDLGDGRQRGWPFTGNRLTVSIQNGGDTWTQTASEVAKGWLMSYGDDLERYEEVYMGIPETEFADQDVVLRVWTTEGRELLLLLDHVIKDYGIGDWADTITYWEVVGCSLESGQELPEERVGQDYRREDITLDRTLEGETEQVPCFLYSAGGDYGLYTWSMYIPYEQWSCNYLVNRWCPNQDDMTTYIEVREHDAAYTAETFFDSYEQQFEEVWTNEAVYGTGDPDTVTVAWALGYQSAGGGRYTESYLFTGQGHVFEVLWTYAAEAAEGWGARMRWAADTFAIIGDTQAYMTGELTQVKPGEVLVVEQAADENLIPAGTYLVLPDDSAYRLENYVTDGLATIISNICRNGYAEGTIGTPEVRSIQRVDHSTDAYLAHTVGASLDTETELFLVEWDAPVLVQDFQTRDGDRVENGRFIYHDPTYLMINYQNGMVVRTQTDTLGYADSALGVYSTENMLQMYPETHPAIFYDRGTEELYAVSTQPAIMGNE